MAEKYRYLNSSYNECGMDVKGFNQWDEYVDHHCGHLEAFKHYQYYTVKKSLIPRPLNAVLSDDKFIFSSFISSIPGGKN